MNGQAKDDTSEYQYGKPQPQMPQHGPRICCNPHPKPIMPRAFAGTLAQAPNDAKLSAGESGWRTILLH